MKPTDDTASITSASPLLPPSYDESTRAPPAGTPTEGSRHRLRARLRTALSDVGTPPTLRYDAAHGLETPRHFDVGMLRAAAART